MAQPKKKLSSSRGKRRRSHLRLAMPSPTVCAKCHLPLMSHTVCTHCGYYKGKLVLASKG